MTVEEARKIDSGLKSLSDEEMENIILELTEMASLALEAYSYEAGSKISDGLLQECRRKE